MKKNRILIGLIQIMKRIFDIFFAFILICIFLIPAILITLVLFLISEGDPIYWSDRVGINNKLFRMPKFRTMQINTPVVATHLLKNPSHYCTPIGSFLRKSSLDELPQLWSILRGDMSFVGPRPALFNQFDLIDLRTKLGVHKLLPGLTGLAQINGRDKLSVSEKVTLDASYLKQKNFWLDIKILCKTINGIIRSKGISH